MRIATTTIVISVILFLLTAASLAHDPKQSKIGVGKIAPNFVGTDIYGKRIELQEFKGRVVILTVDKTRSPTTSEEERNKLKKFYDDHHQQGLEIIRIAYKSGIPFFITKSYVEKRARGSHEKRQTKWIVIIDWECSIKEIYNVTDEPMVLVVDKKGIIQYKNTGELIADDELNVLIPKLLKE